MKFNKLEKSWILYDVANSAFVLIITATIPIYFRSLATDVDSNVVTALWGSATSISLLILALFAPVIGAIADYKGYKKKLFIISLIIGIFGALSFTISTHWQAFLFFYIIARIGYSACNVFYDGMLVDITTDERMDAISSYGYAYGYIGSTIPFVVGLGLILGSDYIGIGTTFATQISFIITILWWGLLSIPLIKTFKQRYYLKPQRPIVSNAFKRVFETLKNIRKEPLIFTYIVAYFFFIDGVYTIISMATTFGGEVGIDDTQMLLALLLTQFIAFPFAILASKLADRYPVISIIKVYVLTYMGVALFGFFLQYAWQFWLLAIVIGMVQGGVQSLSRSYFGQIIPKDKANEYFGFFDIFGKFADVLGPLIISISSIIFKQARFGILGLIILFIIGYVLLNMVEKIDDRKNR